MAASIVENFPIASTPRIITQTKLKTLVADAIENIAHGGPAGAKVQSVTMEVTTRPTDGSPVLMEWQEYNDSLTNDTVALKFYTIPGGSLTGAIVRVNCVFGAVASGGITAP